MKLRDRLPRPPSPMEALDKVRETEFWKSVFRPGSRADSPAHHSHHLEIALRILREHQPQDVTSVGEIDLISLLRSGIPVELAGDRRLIVGVLQPDSPFVGTTVAVSGRQLGGGDANIIAILRGEHMTVPNPKMQFEAGDRLILVVSAAHLDDLRRDLAPW